jgi:sigma-B regulation protein RsbU (phosphoserine phosphatase)
VEISNAGHVPPLVARGRQIERLSPNGIPIGMFCDTRFSATRLRLSPGDTILLYTDGVNEARDGSGGEYGIDRLTGRLAAGAAHAAPDLVGALVQDLRSFRSGAAQADDLTLMAVRRVE